MNKIKFYWDVISPILTILLIIFLIVSPFIGMVMLLGLISTSIAMVCMFLKDFIMEKFYEQN